MFPYEDDDIEKPLAEAPPNYITLLGTKIFLPLENLTIGGSFFIPVTSPKLVYHSVPSLCRRWGYKMVSREEIRLNLLGVRFWRVA